MSERLPPPKLDENAKVGLTLISAVYGVVLVTVFPTSGTSLSHIGMAGWFHLGLTTFMLIVSWMGYYNNRQTYPVWRAQFFNIPLLQYFISFAILFGYWELGVTGESANSGAVPTPDSEALIVVLVFGAYLLWDFLEIAVQESPKYTEVLIHSGQTSSCPPQRDDFHLLGGAPPVPTFLSHRDWFAKNIRGGRCITFVFVVLYGIGLLLARAVPLRGTVTVCVFDGVYILSLFAYRYAQWWWPRHWYVRVLDKWQ